MHRWLAALLAVALLAAGEAAVPAGAQRSSTPHFAIESWAPPEATAVVAAELEATRRALAGWLGRNLGKPVPTPRERLAVRLFADRAAFSAYAKATSGDAGIHRSEAFYRGGDAGRCELVLFRDGGNELGSARHELTHHLLDLVLPPLDDAPLWFNEGLAVNVEVAWLLGDDLRLPTVLRQRDQFLAEACAPGGKALPLAELVRKDTTAWSAANARDRGDADLQYSQAYLLVHHLLAAAPASAESYWALLRALSAGRPYAQAAAGLLADLPRLDAACRAWALADSWDRARAAPAGGDGGAAADRGWALRPDRRPGGDWGAAAESFHLAANAFAATGQAREAAAAAYQSAWCQLQKPAQGAAWEAVLALLDYARGLYAGCTHTAGEADCLLAQARALADPANPRADRARAAEAARQAVARRQTLDARPPVASALVQLGLCLAPDADGKGGDRTEALAALNRARDIFRDGKDADGEAATLLHLARTALPPVGTPGDAAQALAWAEAAERAWSGAGDAKRDGRADALAVQAQALRPDRATAGSWAAVGLRLAAEERLREELGKDGQRQLARCLTEQARVRQELNEGLAAAALYVRAEEIYRVLADAARAAWCAYQAGWWSEPRRSAGGDAARAAEHYRRAAMLYAQAGDEEGRAAALVQRANAIGGADATDHAAAAAAWAEAEAAARAHGAWDQLAICLYQQAWHRAPDRDRLGGDAVEAARLFGLAAEAYAKAGQAKEQALALLNRAGALQDVKGGDPSQTVAAYRAAGDLWRKLGDQDRTAYCLYQQAWYGEPERHPRGDARASARLYDQSAILREKLGRADQAAVARQQQARCLTPGQAQVGRPSPDWQEAAAAWGRAAGLLAQVAQAAPAESRRQHLSAQGGSLHQQAWCLIAGDAARMTPEARRLFGEAARLKREAGDAKGAEAAESWVR